MFCPSCGTAVQRPNQRFCTSCGIALVDTSVHTSTEAVTATPAAPDAPVPAAPVPDAAAVPEASGLSTFAPLAPVAPAEPPAFTLAGGADAVASSDAATQAVPLRPLAGDTTATLPTLAALTPLLPTTPIAAVPATEPATAEPTTVPTTAVPAVGVPTAAVPLPVLPPPVAPAAVPAAAPTLPVTTIGDVGSEPTVPVEALAAALRDTTALRVVEQTAHTQTHDLWSAAAPAATAATAATTAGPVTAGDPAGAPTMVNPAAARAATIDWSVLDPTPAAMPTMMPGEQYPEAFIGEPDTSPTPFRITPLLAVSALAAVLAVAAAVVDVATWEVTGTETNAFSYKLNDLASNYMVGAIIAALVLVAGAAVGATGRRIGSGLAGGAGLALAGMMAMMAGQVTAVFDQKDIEYLLKANADSAFSYTLTITQELGFWLGVAAAALGVVAFVLSVAAGRGPDRRPPMPAVLSVIAAVATLLVVVGTLLPMEGAEFADQFSNDFTPPATLLLRLLVLALIAVGGITGFVNGRRWGIGIALGTISIGVWQWVTAITESGDLPWGIALGNWGATDFAPHIVTTVGVITMVLAAVAGLVVKPSVAEVAQS